MLIYRGRLIFFVSSRQLSEALRIGNLSLTSQPEVDMYRSSLPFAASIPPAALGPVLPAGHVIVVEAAAANPWAQWPLAGDGLPLKSLIQAAVLGLLLLVAKPAAADSARMLGYAVGQSTYEEVKASLQQRGANPRNEGVSAHAGGPMLEASSAESLGIEGLQGAFMVFDGQNRLAGGLLTLNKSRYDAVVTALKEKYTLVREVRPFVGNRLAEFRADGALITVDSPHLSFQMTVLYRTPAVKESMEREDAARAANRRRTDREQF